MDIKAITHLGRFKDIILTLLKYGLDDVVERLDLPGKVFIERIGRVDKGMSTRERIRHVLEDLGPTFIKFGQLMSLRPDLIPFPLIQELRKLQDEVAPVPFPEIREMVEKNLGRPLEEVFSSFEETPLAAASLAQVHRAVLRKEGKPVAVKVRRPGIRRVVEMDLYIMEVIARQLDKRMDGNRVYDFPNLVEEIKVAFRRELDFTREARNMKIFKAGFKSASLVYLPELYEAYCTEQILTMDLIQGAKLKDLDLQHLENREDLAKRILHFTLKQIIEEGFFHADPHPGNILILEESKICLLDWGMVGRLTRQLRYDLVDLLLAIFERDEEKVLWTLLSLTARSGPVHRQKMQREIADILDAFHSRPLGEVHIGHLLLDISTLLRENRLQIPADLALMIKVLVTAEGTARQLCPELNVIREFEPYIKRVARERWHPEAVLERLRLILYKFLFFQKNLPARIDHIIDVVERGELNIHFQHENLENLQKSLERSSNRLTLGIIIAALIIGSSMIVTTGFGPMLSGVPALGIIGYIVSGVLGLWLAFNIIRTRKF
ncbi:MAG: phosphotransferase [Deltaproteobacteria bacterium]|nr:phosphotransferase [Deltaproteobacteria bacterium]